jgi:hypothetical protein
MTDRWGTERWSVRLPDEWSGETDDDGTKILAPPAGEGLLQIRDFLSDGPDIGDDDLRELARFHVERGATLLPMRYGGGFTGFHVHFEAEGTLWWEWWLRRNRLALHATWHVPRGEEGRDEATVSGILNSLRDESDRP